MQLVCVCVDYIALFKDPYSRIKIDERLKPRLSYGLLSRADIVST